MAELDFTKPCGVLIPRPSGLQSRRLKGFRLGAPLWCNRPTNHDGEHVCYSPTFERLAVLVERG